jgi:citrate synthase
MKRGACSCGETRKEHEPMNIQSKSIVGLDGVIAAETVLSDVDGLKGELVIAGSRVGDMAFGTDFEALAARLWSLAGKREWAAQDVRTELGAARARTFSLLPRIFAASDDMPIVAGFRVAVAALRPQFGLAHEVALLGAMPVIAAALVRRAAGEEAVEPSAQLGHAADFLRMLRGTDASDAEAAALNAYLVTVSDHGMNASTFAGRVVASTGADLFMAVTAAYCALSGPLHGGAPEPVLDMLDSIGTEQKIAPWIDDALARGERLMGFGHRVYRVRDPRADVLKLAVERLNQGGKDPGFSSKVEAYARKALALHKPDRKLETNVEFYTAILLDALKIPRQAFTPVFAAGRTAGWIAHAIEQQARGRLLRPASAYIGVLPD